MRAWKYLLVLMFVLAITVWIIVFFQKSQTSTFRLIACDVGQGDAILVVYGTTQILMDGGPGLKVINCLEKYLPLTDRKLELVVLTNPDFDHYGGLIEVFKRYEVHTLLANSNDKSSSEYGVLKSLVGGSATTVIYPKEGMVMRSGEIQLDILWPTDFYYLAQADLDQDKKVLGSSSVQNKPNNFSIVTHLKFGEFDALLTGDIEEETSDVIADKIAKDKQNTTFEYIKVPHHGSTNGLTKKLLDTVKPQIAVISAGKNNSYGHPRAEIIDMLSKSGAKIRRTDLEGDVVIEIN